jgi:histidinol-phosphate/aromatic aminotransferase/cobyric acid decarboxylase-like protein
VLERRVRAIQKERPRATAGLRQRGFNVTDSQANFLWVAHPTIEGAELATRLSRSGVLVAAGDALGEPQHVRIALHSARSTDRLLNAVDKALEGGAAVAPEAAQPVDAELD